MIDPRIPGGPSLPEIPGGRYDPDRARRLRDEIFSVASDTQAKIAGSIAENLADVQAVCAQIQAKYLGQAGVTLDSIREVCNRIAEKIKAGLVTKWAEVEAYINAAGFTLGDIANATYPQTGGRNVLPMGGQNASALPSSGGSAGTSPAVIPPTPYGVSGSYGQPGQILSQAVTDSDHLTTLDGGGIDRDPSGPTYQPPAPPVIDPGPGVQQPPGPNVPPLPPGPPPYQPPPTVPGQCYSYPAPPGVNAPWGVSWQGIPCSDPATCGTTLNPCSCPPGQYWGGPFVGCNNPTGGTPPPVTQFPPMPPACQCGCCQSCNDRNPCPDGYEYQPPGGPTNPTLVGGGGADPFGPTLKGGGDLTVGGYGDTLHGGGGPPILIADRGHVRVELTPVEGCWPHIAGGWTGICQPANRIIVGPGHYQLPPWLDNSIPCNDPNINAGVEVCYIDGCHLIPPRSGQLAVYKPAGWTLLVGNVSLMLFCDNLGQQPESTLVPCVARAPDTPAIDPGNPSQGTIPPGRCVPKPPDPNAGKCPVKPDLACGADAKVPKVPGMEEPFNPCDAIKKATDKIKEDNLSIADAFKIKEEVQDAVTESWKATLRAVIGTSETGAIPALMQRFSNWLDKFVRDSAKDQSCDTASLLPVIIKRAIIHFVQKWTDVIPDQLIRELDQVSNSICQSRLPSGSEADRAWLKGTITDEEWECYHKAEGNFVDPMRKLVKAERTQPNVKEVITLYRRELIDAVELFKRLRNLGVIDPQEQKYLYDLSEQRPSASDLIRYMKRDSFDPDAIAAGKLDEDFDKKWTDEAAKLGKAIGLTDRQAFLEWASHWQFPSYTQGREMVYRLRPDAVDGKLAFTVEQFREMLKIDDMAPGFVDRLIEIAYHPLLTTDAERMYQVRQIDETALAGVYMDHGYKAEVAAAKVEYSKLQRQFYDLQRAGFPSLSELNRLYGQCLIDAGTLEDGIQRWVTSDEQAAEAIETAEIRRSITERRMLIQRIQKEYRYGLIDDGQATQELADGGIDPGCISGLVRRFRSQRQRQPKQAAASTLCKWFAHGILTADQFLEALIRQGWNTDDALRIVRECEYEQAERTRKAQEATAAKAARIRERETKAAEKAAKATRKKGSQGG